jgi:branched-subunit amino acid aminotransferase/4-amino-4-deoxychorismate lyase
MEGNDKTHPKEVIIAICAYNIRNNQLARRHAEKDGTYMTDLPRQRIS